jgi:hypothetical protein
MSWRVEAIAALAGLALLAAGCASGSTSPPVASIGATTASPPTASTSSTASGSTTGRLIAYSTCMRTHDVPGFPDPNSKGELLVTPSNNIDPSSPVFQSAEQACAKLRAAAQGPGMTPAQHAAALARLTKFADCMRRRQIPMADPFSGPNGGVGIAIPRSVDLSSQVYKQAEAACDHLLPAG